MNRRPSAVRTPLPQSDGTVPGWLAGAANAEPVWTPAVPVPIAYGTTPNEQGFVALQSVYRPSGGLARGADLASRLQHRRVGGYVSLARLIVNRQVFSFSWQNDDWLPMFQFDTADLSLRPAVQDILAELLDIMDGWTLALWFVQANRALGQVVPLDLLQLDPAAVLQAAARARDAS